MSHKATTDEAFEDINQVVIDVISNNMASLVKYGKCVPITTTDATIIVSTWLVFLRGVHFTGIHHLWRTHQ